MARTSYKQYYDTWKAMYISGKSSTCRAYKWMYSGSTIYLARKKHKFRELVMTLPRMYRDNYASDLEVI